jgi:hypothetical protein
MATDYSKKAAQFNNAMRNWTGTGTGLTAGNDPATPWGAIFYEDVDALNYDPTQENYDKVANQISAWNDSDAWGTYRGNLNEFQATKPESVTDNPLDMDFFNRAENKYTDTAAGMGTSFSDYMDNKNAPTLAEQAETIGNEADDLEASVGDGDTTTEGETELDANSLSYGTNQASYDALSSQAQSSGGLAALLDINKNKNDYFNTGMLDNVGTGYSGTLADSIAAAIGQQGASQFATYDGAAAPRAALNAAISNLTGISNDRDQYVNNAINTSAGSYNAALNSLRGVEGSANTNQYNADALANLLSQVNNTAGSGLSSSLNTDGYDQSAISTASGALGTEKEALRTLLGRLEETRYGNVSDMVGRRGDLDDSLSGLDAWDEEGINALIGSYDTLRRDASGYSGGRTQTLRDNIGTGQGNANQKLQDLFGTRDEIGGEAEALYELLGKQNYYGLNDVSDQETVLQTLKDRADHWGASGASGNIGYAEDFLNRERDRIKQDQTNVMTRNAGSASNMRAYLDSMGLGNSTSLDRFLANTWQGGQEEDPRKNGSFWGDAVNSGFNWL